MQTKRKPRRPELPPEGAELLTDPQGAALGNVGLTAFAELQHDPEFPRPVWLGPRLKRHVRAELQAFFLSKRERIVEPTPPARRRGGVELEVKA